MAYGFNDDRSKADVYSADEIDTMLAASSAIADAKNEAQDFAINSEIEARTAADALISGEISNARIGYDDTVYATVGEAIRSQIDDIHTILDGILESINS